MEFPATPDSPQIGIFFNPKPLHDWREVQLDGQKVWRYRWSGEDVYLEAPDGTEHAAKTWHLLEITSIEYREWAREPDSGLVITAKDVSDFIKEKILKKTASRRVAGLYS